MLYLLFWANTEDFLRVFCPQGKAERKGVMA